jgi:hypothetical protein
MGKHEFTGAGGICKWCAEPAGKLKQKDGKLTSCAEAPEQQQGKHIAAYACFSLVSEFIKDTLNAKAAAITKISGHHRGPTAYCLLPTAYCLLPTAY